MWPHFRRVAIDGGVRHEYRTCRLDANARDHRRGQSHPLHPSRRAPGLRRSPGLVGCRARGLHPNATCTYRLPLHDALHAGGRRKPGPGVDALVCRRRDQRGCQCSRQVARHGDGREAGARLARRAGGAAHPHLCRARRGGLLRGGWAPPPRRRAGRCGCNLLAEHSGGRGLTARRAENRRDCVAAVLRLRCGGNSDAPRTGVADSSPPRPWSTKRAPRCRASGT